MNNELIDIRLLHNICSNISFIHREIVLALVLSSYIIRLIYVRVALDQITSVAANKIR